VKRLAAGYRQDTKDAKKRGRKEKKEESLLGFFSCFYDECCHHFSVFARLQM
jgi:hypothetical protein